MTDQLDIVKKNHRKVSFFLLVLLLISIGFSVYTVITDKKELDMQSMQMMDLQDKLSNLMDDNEVERAKVQRLEGEKKFLEEKLKASKSCEPIVKIKKIPALPLPPADCPEMPKTKRLSRSNGKVIKNTFLVKDHYSRWDLAAQSALRFANIRGFDNIISIETIDSGYTVWHIGPEIKTPKIPRDALIEYE